MERNISIKVWKLLPSRRVLKTMRLMEYVTSQSGQYLLAAGFELLQMVSEPDIGRCASEDAEPSREMDCEILHRLEIGMKQFL